MDVTFPQALIDGSAMPGTLYLVATPIGNLEDFTFRAVRILKEVRLIAAEDTRRTAKLLRHYGIATPATSLHDHNERQSDARVWSSACSTGDSIALLSDAGTPLVSDPGFNLVRQSLDARIRVTALPGPSAVTAALISCGAPVAELHLPRLPAPPAQRQEDDGATTWLASLEPWCSSKSPHRLAATLELLEERLGERTVALCRELTKLHESTLVGTVSSLLQSVGTPRGEYTCVVWPASDDGDITRPPDGQALIDELDRLADERGSRREAVKAMADQYGLSARAMYQAIEAAKGLAP